MIATVLVIDNYDSFTFNLVQGLQALGADVRVRRNDAVTVGECRALAPTHVVVSPGPGRPEDAGASLAVIEAFAGRVPVLGVCLGHQCLGLLYGAKVGRAQRPMHGKTSAVRHDGRTLFRGLSDPFTAGRYHSLVIHEATLPPALAVTARSEDGEVMGVRDAALGLEGVQFHPESILTPEGDRLLANFLERPLLS